jgi:ankyrin repeat protein
MLPTYSIWQNSTKKFDLKEALNVQTLQFQKTALHFAALRGNTQVFQMLLEKGADLNIVNMRGWIPINLAVKSEKYFSDLK